MKHLFFLIVLIASILVTGPAVDAQSYPAQVGTFNVSGWAWAETIGWISFNAANDHDPVADGVQPSSINYGVNSDPINGIFSGYAWSPHVGWISFNKSDTLEPPYQPFNNGSQNYIAKRDGNFVFGWGKILSLGERGWLRFGNNAASSSITIDAMRKFTGWMWNGNNDGTGIGWVSLQGNDYAVALTSSFNVAPHAPILESPPHNADHLATSKLMSNNVITNALSFVWSAFRDTNQPNDCEQKFTMEVLQGSTIDASFTSLPDPDCTTPLDYNETATHRHNFFVGSGLDLAYNTTYTWRVKTYDKAGVESPLSQEATFETPKHPLPKVDFTWSPTNPKEGDAIQFTDTSVAYGSGAAIQWWEWSFTEGGTTTTVKNAVVSNPDKTETIDGAPQTIVDYYHKPTHTYATKGTQRACLTVTDKDNYVVKTCHDISVTTKQALPIWRRIIPF